MIVSNAPLGFSIRSVGRDIKRGAGAAAKLAYKPVEWTLIKPTEWLTHQAMRPVAAVVHRIRDRRAMKLAWDKRKSKTPNAAERAEAKSWTKSKLNHELPHGPILALFAGADPYGYEPLSGQLGIAPVVIAAAIPVLMALAQQMLKRFSSSGEAPASPGADAASAAEGAGAGAAPGTVDLSPVQDAAADAAQSAADSLEKGGHGKRGKMPGGMSKKQLMIGGAVVGALALVLVLTKKKD